MMANWWVIHELGHCLGLDHSSGANDTMNGGYEYHRQRFGPFNEDVRRVRLVYPSYTDNRMRQLRSTDGGSSWTAVNNNITTHGHTDSRTNINAGVVATAQSGFYVTGWSIANSSIPTWLRGDGDHFLLRHWLYYGGERSIYGPVYAADDDRTLLWTWVTNDDLGTIKIVRSHNQGYQWHWINVPPGARTYGTPALCWTRVAGQSTWLLLWPHFDRGDHANSGYLRVSLSTNEGNSWSSPVVLDSFYKVLSGVSAAADHSNHVIVAFSWASHSTYGMNYIRAFECQVNGGQLQRNSIIYGMDDTTRIQPAVTYDAQANRFLLAWRGQDFNTSLNVTHKAPGTGTWTSHTQLPFQSHVAPALAHSRQYGESVLWYASE